mgnify:CR=1 FL=1
MDLDKLLAIGDRCIHDEPPICEAKCPVHIEVKDLIGQIEKGDFKKAYRILERKIPFTRIIGKICDHPCEDFCVRKEAGGSIGIGDLEKTVVNKGYAPPKKRLAIPKKDKSVAIIGGGISGLVAAHELDRKGYQITIFEKSHRLGGRIWNFVGGLLKKEVVQEELQVLWDKGVNIELNVNVDGAKLEEIIDKYDGVFLTSPIIENIEYNPTTFQVDNSKLFVRGNLTKKSSSVIYAVSYGKAAGISIDRYLSNVSMMASREREGVFDTPLKYDTQNVPYLERIQKKGQIYTVEEAQKEAKRCLKCQCTDCIDGCSHMQKFNMPPNAYIRQINQSERIILGTHYANKMINSCTLCGLCKEECFLDISMKEVIQETRESMVARGKMPISAHDFALKDMKFSNSTRFYMVRGQGGGDRSKRDKSKGNNYLFYPGCQLPASMPEYMADIYSYLTGNLTGDVGIFLACCGAPADWGGRQSMLEENVRRIKKEWQDMGKPIFILACSSCYEIFKKFLPEIQCISLWEIFDKYGLPRESKRVTDYPLNLHDACSTRYNKKLQDSTRSIVTSLGYEIKEFTYSRERAKCCGYGGLVYFANREQAEEFVEDRKKESNGDILVYCAMCKDLFIRSGKRAYHILDLIFADDVEKTGLRKMPNLSQRHFNRTWVKINLLKEFWGEDRMDLKKDYDFNLIVSEGIFAIMEDRYILKEDIQEVIDHAQKTGERFFNPDTSNYLAKLRLDNVTYWVQYELDKEDIIVNKVYSHRMEVIEK